MDKAFKNDKTKLIEEIIKDIKNGIRDFGEYTYHDKRARETTNLSGFVATLSKMPGAEIGDVLAGVLAYKDGAIFVQDALVDLQEIDEAEWDAIFAAHPELQEHF